MDQKTDKWNGYNFAHDSPFKLFKIGYRTLRLLSDILGVSENLGAKIEGNGKEKKIRD